MIKNILKIGGKRLAQLILILGLVLILNALFFVLNILDAFLWHVLLSLILGLASSVFALWRIYTVIMLEVFKILYDQFTPQVEEFSNKVVIAVKKNMKSEHVERGRLVSDQLDGLPWVFRFPMRLLLKFIPILKLIDAAKKALLEHNEAYAAKQFHKDLDEVIQEVYFDATSLKWIFWLLPVIVIGQGFLLYF